MKIQPSDSMGVSPNQRRALRPAFAALLCLVAATACFEDDGDGGAAGAADSADIVTDGTLAEPCPLGEKCPCEADAECESGVCIDAKDGAKHCAQPCGDGCEDGYTCEQIVPGGGLPGEATPTGEGVWVCVPEPCTLDEKCDGKDNDCDGETDEETCDDGNPCTIGGCDPAKYTPLAEGCTWTAADGAACEDGDPCSTADSCLAGACVSGAGPDCDDGSPCTIDACEPSGGACSHEMTEGACEDGNACTEGDHCEEGACTPGLPTDCDDGYICTDDACDPVAGCVYASNIVACDDGNVCTVDDACLDGDCKAGALNDCDDDNVCTLNWCDPALGAVELSDGCTLAELDAVCDDASPCTVGDSCIDGACEPGIAKDCADENSCTQDACDAESGACLHLAQEATTTCDDGSPCTADDLCNHAVECVGTPKVCDDDNACTIDVCDNNTGACLFEDNSGLPCEDGDPCTLGDACQLGGCAAGKPKVCDDSLLCTDDGCDGGSGECVFAPNVLPCTDGNPCTLVDVCDGGDCAGGEPVVCDDGKLCTVEACSTKTGACKVVPNVDGIICDDGLACTTGEHCVLGECAAAKPVFCDDNNPCTDDACDQTNGECVSLPNKATCDDGNICTSGDGCLDGACSSGPNSCECLSNDDCVAKEDGNKCNGTLFCDLNAHTCNVDENTIVLCDPAKNTDCLIYTCGAFSGVCEAKAVIDETPCEADESVCTVGDACVAGICLPGLTIACDDGNPCTNDACDPVGGCFYEDNQVSCQDGDACTSGDVCQDGGCVSGITKVCNDGDPCTADSCDFDSGECLVSPTSGADCDDGSACTVGDHCENGGCAPASLKTCPDENPCTYSACNGDTGQCETTPYKEAELCDDGQACTTTDGCNNGACIGGPLQNCDDGNVCTIDWCDLGTQDCAHKPGSDGAACSDGNACTLKDFCLAGVCQPEDSKLCEDNNACTADICNQTTGQCEYKNLTDGTECTDDNACSFGDACQTGTCTASKWTVCNDGNGCTNDSCDAKSGVCKYLPNSKKCSDGSACTTGDVCKAAVCTPTGKPNCNDNNPCTTDGCDPKTGCTHKLLGVIACNDGNACTDNDMCSVLGKCQGDGKVCNDGVACTTDTCSPKSGCVYANNKNACNDGNYCTVNDHCSGGKCGGGGPRNCSDANVCTDDGCDPIAGCGHVKDDTNKCSDSNPCTADDACVAGNCMAGGPTDCDDANPCSTDACDPKIGCTHGALGDLPCDDGNACTAPDVCKEALCVGGSPLDCNDANTCTADACDGKTGCTHLETTDTCDDGNPCAGPDKCEAGVCKAKALLICNDENVCTDDVCDGKVGCVHSPAVGDGAAQITFVSDVQTKVSAKTKWVDAKLEQVDPINGVPTHVGDGWTDKIAGAVWIWHEAEVSQPAEDTEGLFIRSFQVPVASTNLDGGLQVAADGGFTCWFNNALVLEGVPPSNASSPQSASLKALLVLGKNELKCLVTNPGVAGANYETNPAGLLFRMDVLFDINSKLCDDGNTCSALDICQDGQCVGTNGLNCDDANSCTIDACEAKIGCTHSVAQGAVCSDGDPCSSGDVCNGGVCAGAGVTNCNDGNLCTDDDCDAKSGCVHVPKKPGDKNTLAVVSDSQTLADDEVDFNKGDPQQKNPVPAVAAWDGYAGQYGAWVKDIPGATWIWLTNKVDNPTLESYDVWFFRTFDVPSGAAQVTGTLWIAADNIFDCRLNGKQVGLIDDSDHAWDVVRKLPLTTALKIGENTLKCMVSNLGGAGKTWQTNPAGLLYRAEVSWFSVDGALTCQDGNFCTVNDACAEGVCASGPLDPCDDENTCTDDSCDPTKGCVHGGNDANPCNDANLCTVDDGCTGGKCVGPTPVDCNDANACTNDVCIPYVGCLHEKVDEVQCEDGDQCTTNDACDAGVCVASGVLDCDDGQPCTADVCWTAKGCINQPADGGACDDGDTCTADDICEGGSCLGKDASDCNDANVCTDDSCNPAFGCVHVKTSGGVCEDGTGCTLDDVCVAGDCKGGAPKACFDTETCTADSCDLTSGECVFAPIEGEPCDDDNACTLNDACSDGDCQPGDPRPCGDGNTCTTDNCKPISGECFHVVVGPGSACDDGNLCTVSDACAADKCVGAAKPCDDQNACTMDGCMPADGGCTHTPLADGAPCGKGGTCQIGVCAP